MVFRTPSRDGAGDAVLNGTIHRLRAQSRRLPKKLKERVCALEGCNNKFKPKSTLNKYCSVGCATKGYTIENGFKSSKVVCARDGCGGTFLPRNSLHKFCSRKCGMVVNRAETFDKYQNTKTELRRTCPECKKSFKTTNTRKRFCSRFCSYTFHNKKRIAERFFNKKEKTCALERCTNTFMPRSSAHKYCSVECQELNTLKRRPKLKRKLDNSIGYAIVSPPITGDGRRICKIGHTVDPIKRYGVFTRYTSIAGVKFLAVWQLGETPEDPQIEFRRRFAELQVKQRDKKRSRETFFESPELVGYIKDLEDKNPVDEPIKGMIRNFCEVEW